MTGFKVGDRVRIRGSSTDVDEILDEILEVRQDLNLVRLRAWECWVKAERVELDNQPGTRYREVDGMFKYEEPGSQDTGHTYDAITQRLVKDLDETSVAKDYYGAKFDADKLDWTLLPPLAAWEILKASVDTVDDAFTHLLEFRCGERRECLLQAARALEAGSGAVAFQGVVQVLAFGARKYARDTWRAVPDAATRYWSAAVRHLVAEAGGEVNDPESGLPHVAHALCNIIFVLELTR